MRTRTRVYRKQYWFTKEECELLRVNSSLVGMNESDYMRSLLLGYKPREKPDDRFYEMLKLMRSISNNINQISKKAHSLGFIDELAYQKEAERWRKLITEMKDEYLTH